LPTFNQIIMRTFKVSPKSLAALPGLSLTKTEVEHIAQVFGLRIIDWRRLSDKEASDWFVGILNKNGPDHIFNALTRVRRLAGRERGMWLAFINATNPTLNVLKNPPDWDVDELWRIAFKVFLVDEITQTTHRIQKQATDRAIDAQL